MLLVLGAEGGLREPNALAYSCIGSFGALAQFLYNLGGTVAVASALPGADVRSTRLATALRVLRRQDSELLGIQCPHTLALRIFTSMLVSCAELNVSGLHIPLLCAILAHLGPLLDLRLPGRRSSLSLRACLVGLRSSVRLSSNTFEVPLIQLSKLPMVYVVAALAHGDVVHAHRLLSYLQVAVEAVLEGLVETLHLHAEDWGLLMDWLVGGLACSD